jgi:hypothetical protein
MKTQCICEEGIWRDNCALCEGTGYKIDFEAIIKRNTMKTKIRTKYVAATNTRGAKIVAYGYGKQKSIPYPYELSGEHVHRKAAKAWVDWHISRNGWADTSKITIETHYVDHLQQYIHIIK